MFECIPCVQPINRTFHLKNFMKKKNEIIGGRTLNRRFNAEVKIFLKVLGSDFPFNKQLDDLF